jgi:hypothetical protein
VTVAAASENGAAGAAADPAFSIAFALGWETASLFRGASFDAGRSEDGDDGLPGLVGLDARQRTELAIDLITANLHKLEERLSAAGAIDPTLLDDLRATLVAADAGDRKPLRAAVRALHLEVMRTLTAAQLRLGRAYGLGHALAETCLQPVDRDSFDRAFGARLISVKDWLADLSSSFPPHSARAVVLSLRAWESWAAHPEIEGKPLLWKTHGAGVRDALHRQGELWRDLLAHDKDGEDMLDTNHYLRAASSLVGAMALTVWRFMRPLRIPLAIAVPVLVVGLILLIFSESAARTLGAILAAFGAIGITGAGLRARLGQIATELQMRLWGAEMDYAIAAAVLTGPEGWDASIAKVAVPATGAEPKVSGNVETLRLLRRAADRGSSRAVRRLLAPDVEFATGNGEPLHQPQAVARWIVASANWLATEPTVVEAIGTGVILTERGEHGAEVWRVQEGKVRWAASCPDRERARATVLANGAHA